MQKQLIQWAGWASLGTALACSTPDKPEERMAPVPPVADQRPYDITTPHGHTRTDEYYWLRERDSADVVAYLTAENQYLDSVMAHTEALQEELFEELRGRIQEDDASVPYRLDGYYYYTRFVEGGEYPLYCRRKGDMEQPEEILLDGNQLGQDQAYLSFYPSISPDHQLAAVVMDTVGRNFYTIRVKDLRSGQMHNEQIAQTRGAVVWTNDNQSFFYTVPDPVTLRTFQVKRHQLGTDPEQDELVYEETDQTLSCYLGKTKSRRFITINSGRTDAGCVRVLDADRPGQPRLIAPLQDNVQYSVNHAEGDHFYLYTNQDAPNYRLVRTPLQRTTPEHWQDVIAHRADVFLSDVDYFREYLVLQENREGLARIRLVRWDDGSTHEVAFDEPAYAAELGYNPEFDTRQIQYEYTSMTTPASTYEYDMTDRTQRLLKMQPVLGGFDRDHYATERVMVTARDGQRIPLSLVYRKDKFKPDGTRPGWIYGYGSYGNSMDASFSPYRLSLLDRGFVYAIAHVRGGQEMGGQWYEDGKMMNKRNTFTDFVDCSQWLIDNQYVAADQLFASGGSAGGLLMGAVANMAPGLYRGIVAAVPFVDVVTTMLDESIPLTTFEWLEWGNPNVPEQYEYMLSYSPYDNVATKDYPNMLVMTGLHDSQVQYWEPAKWVARLRARKTDQNRLLLHTNMEAGHGGASGRFRRLKEIALQYAFALDLLGLGEAS